MAENFQIYKNINNKLSALELSNNPMDNENLKFLRLPLPNCYAGIVSVKVYSPGHGFAGTTTIRFPKPDLESGVQATGEVILGITKASFTLMDGGNNYKFGDTFFVVNEMDKLVGFLIITDVDSSGKIMNFGVLNMYEYSCKGNPRVILRDNTSASFVGNDQNFQILAVKMTQIGSGYESIVMKNGFPTRVNHKVSLSNYGNGQKVVMETNKKILMTFKMKPRSDWGASNNVLFGIGKFEIDPDSISYKDNNFSMENNYGTI